MADDRYKLGSFYRTNQGSFIRSPMGARGAPIPLEPPPPPAEPYKLSLTNIFCQCTGTTYYPNTRALNGTDYWLGQRGRTADFRTLRMVSYAPAVLPAGSATYAYVQFIVGTYSRTVDVGSISIEVHQTYKDSTPDANTAYDFINRGKIGDILAPGNASRRVINIPVDVSMILPGEDFWIVACSDRDFNETKPGEDAATGDEYTLKYTVTSFLYVNREPDA